MIVTESKNRKIKICDQILEEIYSQIQKNDYNGVYAYWGEWHTHPEDIPHYSIIDLKNWKRIGKEDPKGVQYHIIAGRKAFSIWRMQKGKLCPKKICEVKWNEINL